MDQEGERKSEQIEFTICDETRWTVNTLRCFEHTCTTETPEGHWFCAERAQWLPSQFCTELGSIVGGSCQEGINCPLRLLPVNLQRKINDVSSATVTHSLHMVLTKWFAPRNRKNVTGRRAIPALVSSSSSFRMFASAHCISHGERSHHRWRTSTSLHGSPTDWVF